jgi:SAM-dependent methyltransferase
LVLGRDYNWKIDATPFEVRQCDACGFAYTANPPEDLGRYYTVNHYSRQSMATDFTRFAEAERYKLDLLKQFVSGTSLLEIGSSMGAFCKLAKDDGFSVSAIEMDPGCVAFLNDTLQVRAVQSVDAEAVLRQEGRHYNAITLWHSLEHMLRPWEIISACADHLEPGGVLVIAVPNPQSTQARWMGPRWPHYDLPRHLSHMSPDWLTKTANAKGLLMEFLTTRDEGSLSVNTQSVPLLLLSLTGASADKGFASRAVASLCWRIGRLIARVMAPWDAREGRGAAYTAVFRKPP